MGRKFFNEGGFAPVIREGVEAGFQFEMKLQYYRGITLSIIQNIEVELDGEKLERSMLRIVCEGDVFTLEEAETAISHRWEYGHWGAVQVLTGAAPSEGVHRLVCTQTLRPSYMPFLITAKGETDFVWPPIGDADAEPGMPASIQMQATASGSTAGSQGAAVSDIGFVPTTDFKSASASDSQTASAPIPAGIKQSVSLYSLQDELYSGNLNLEGCLREVAASGATGVEMLGEAVLPHFPNITDAFVEQWFGWLNTHGLQPTCYDAFLESKIYRNRVLTLREQTEMMERDIRIAARLGFPTLRTLVSTPMDVIERSLACAERENVKICLEVHAPFALETPWFEGYMEMVRRTGTEFFGFIPDFGIFFRRIPRIARDFALRHDAHEDLLRRIDDAYAERVVKGTVPIEFSRDLMAANMAWRKANGFFDQMEAMKALGANEADLKYLNSAFMCAWNDPATVTRNMKWIPHTHAKFYEVDAAFNDTSVPLDEVIAAYRAGRYNGYLSSEYEGHHSLEDIDAADSIGQIRRHQEAMRRAIVRG